MISLSMITADTTGQLVITKEVSELYTFDLRVSRAATLDGGCVLINSGLNDSDRTFKVTCELTEANRAVLDYMLRNSVKLLISCADGLFLGAVSSLYDLKGKTKLTILVEGSEL